MKIQSARVRRQMSFGAVSMKELGLLTSDACGAAESEFIGQRRRLGHALYPPNGRAGFE
jgi:hypothetical protein